VHAEEDEVKDKAEAAAILHRVVQPLVPQHPRERDAQEQEDERENDGDGVLAGTIVSECADEVVQ
jgi:hypothetical protein